MTRNRLLWADTAKAIGIFFIVFGHAVPTGIFHQYSFSFHVPLFFFLSGAVFYIENKRFSSFVLQRVKKLLIPYVFFATVSILLYALLGSFLPGVLGDRREIGGIVSQLGEMLFGYCDTNSPLWFLPSLFLTSVLAFPICKLSHKMQSRLASTAVLSVAILLSLGWLLFSDRMRFYKWPWKMELVLHMLSFFLLAYAASQSKLWERLGEWPISMRAAAGAVLLLIGALLAVKNDSVNYVSEYYGNVWLYYISALTSVLGICLLCMIFPANRMITYTGQHTLAVLVMHKFPILFLQTVFPAVNALTGAASLLAGVIISLTSILLCLAAERMIHKMLPFIL